MLAEGILLGLSTGTYCLTACAPVALPFFFSEEGGHRRNAFLVGLFLLGRLVAYLAVGFILGALGSYAAKYVDPTIAHATTRLSAALAGAVLIVSGLARNPWKHRACELARKLFDPRSGAFAVGLATGISLCPPFVAAAARLFGASSSGSGALEGAAFFLAFFLGTTVWFIPLLGVSFVNKRFPLVRTIARMASLMIGAYYLLVVGGLGSV